MKNFLSFKLFLFPFYLLYASIVFVRNWLYNNNIFKSASFDMPIIVVGNLNVGGSGKTPQVEYLIQLLLPNYQIAVLSRGYGRKSKGYHEVKSRDLAHFSGDEPVQIKNKFGEKIRVFVGENRIFAITNILFDYPDIDVILLDDAFQHRSLKPGFSILLTDYSLPFTHDTLLPIGRLREHPIGAKRADIVIVTKCPADLSHKQKADLTSQILPYCNNVFFSSLRYLPIVSFDGDLVNTLNKKFFLVTAIANFRPLESYVKRHYQWLGSKHFVDHHIFTLSDLNFINQKISTFADPNLEVLTTAKDAIRFSDLMAEGIEIPFKINILPVATQILDGGAELNQMIENYVRKSSTNSRFYQVEN